MRIGLDSAVLFISTLFLLGRAADNEDNKEEGPVVPVVPADAHNHPYNPSCPLCQGEDVGTLATGVLNKYPSVSLSSEKKSVLIGDGVHHGRGVLVPVPRAADPLRHAPDEDQLRQAIANTQREEALASIAAKQKELQAKKLEEEIEKEKAHQVAHEREELERLNAIMERDKLKTPEIFGKRAPEVYTFPAEDAPLLHHNMLVTRGLMEIREADKKAIDDAQKVTELHDVTDALKAANPGVETPEDYKNLILPGNAVTNGLIIPTPTKNGRFFIHPAGEVVAPHHALASGHEVPIVKYFSPLGFSYTSEDPHRFTSPGLNFIDSLSK